MGKWVAIRDTLSVKLRLYANKTLEGETDDLTGDISQGENFFWLLPDFRFLFQGRTG
jgi:hypothetical protein